MKRARWFWCPRCDTKAATFGTATPSCRDPRCERFGLAMYLLRRTIPMPWWRDN